MLHKGRNITGANYLNAEKNRTRQILKRAQGEEHFLSKLMWWLKLTLGNIVPHESK